MNCHRSLQQQEQMLKAAADQIQQLELEIKVRGGIEAMRQEGATKRELIKHWKP